MPVLQHSKTLTAAPRYIFQLCQICLCANERVSTPIVSLPCVFQFTSERCSPTPGCTSLRVTFARKYFWMSNYTDLEHKVRNPPAGSPWFYCQNGIFWIVPLMALAWPDWRCASNMDPNHQVCVKNDQLGNFLRSVWYAIDCREIRGTVRTGSQETAL